MYTYNLDTLQRMWMIVSCTQDLGPQFKPSSCSVWVQVLLLVTGVRFRGVVTSHTATIPLSAYTMSCLSVTGVLCVKKSQTFAEIGLISNKRVQTAKAATHTLITSTGSQGKWLWVSFDRSPTPSASSTATGQSGRQTRQVDRPSRAITGNTAISLHTTTTTTDIPVNT
jgi:hypothetical protein